MLIVADENIPWAERLFSTLGEVRLAHGRQMTAELVHDADLLMVRSITQVNGPLLADSRVQFVGTATIGTDHVDQAWLGARGIGFASAPGSNAESVAQYLAAALAFGAGRLGRALSACSLGIIGVGHCGRRVERIARALGMRVLLNDPPLARQTGDPKYRPIEELFDCDFLTLHVPLTREGKDATWRLIDARVMDALKPDAVIINASRGGVVDEAALEARLMDGRLAGAILDAWENEPAINARLLRRVLLGTPHIAGYSYDGKVAGARMIYEAACRHLGVAPKAVELPMPPAAVERIELETRGRTMDSVLAELILTAYPIGRDASDLLAAASPDPAIMGSRFDERRKLYPLRREFAATQVMLKDAPEEWRAIVKTIGFAM